MTEQRLWDQKERCEDYVRPKIGDTHVYLGDNKHKFGQWVFVGWRRNTQGRVLTLVQVPNENVVDRHQTLPQIIWITHMITMVRDFPTLQKTLRSDIK